MLVGRGVRPRRAEGLQESLLGLQGGGQDLDRPRCQGRHPAAGHPAVFEKLGRLLGAEARHDQAAEKHKVGGHLQESLGPHP